MNSNDRPLPLPNKEVIAPDLPDEYQIRLPSRSSALRLLCFSIFWLGSFAFESNNQFSIILSIIFAALFVGFARTDLLRYEVLAIGQGSIAILRKYPFFRQVKWATFDLKQLNMIDCERGLAALFHPGLGEFAKNTSVAELSNVISAIRKIVENAGEDAKRLGAKPGAP